MNNIDWVVLKNRQGENWHHCERLKGEYTQENNYVTIYNSNIIIKLDGDLGKQFWEKLIQSVHSGHRIIELDITEADESELHPSAQSRTR